MSKQAKPSEADLNALMKHNNAIYKSDIDKFWAMLDRCFEIEPREYFEKEARLNGFESPLAMACFFVWKREAKPAASQAREVWDEAIRVASGYANPSPTNNRQSRRQHSPRIRSRS